MYGNAEVLVQCLKSTCTWDEMRKLGQFSLKKALERPGCKQPFSIKGGYKNKEDILSSSVSYDRTRRNVFKLNKGRCGLDIKKLFFTERKSGETLE